MKEKCKVNLTAGKVNERENRKNYKNKFVSEEEIESESRRSKED